MLKKFEVKNYRNFKDIITIDFGKVGGYQFSTDCIKNNVITKMLIYGRNATGKTNLGKAITDIVDTLSSNVFFDEGNFLNADSNSDWAFFTYTFQFGLNTLIYKYSRFSNGELKEEQLFINEKKIFFCDFYNKRYDFNNLSLIGAETAVVERYQQSVEADLNKASGTKLSFLRWIINNVALKNDSLLLQLSDYVSRMTMETVGSISPMKLRSNANHFFEYLTKGTALKEFENFLNYMGIECSLILETLPDGQKELYFKHKKLVPFYENASSGTLALVNLYRKIVIGAKTASFMYLDEFDAFYHYEMAENVVNYLKKTYPGCQIILTSHNTNLMTNRLMRPDCLFILSIRGNLTSLCDATARELREGHNLEKMYISGEFQDYE